MKKHLYIEPGCITCGMCEFLAPQVFEVTDVSSVKIGAKIDENIEKIKEAVLECPVSVIVLKED